MHNALIADPHPAARRLPKQPVVMLAFVDPDEMMDGTSQAGMPAYLLSSDDHGQLIAALDGITTGEWSLPAMAQRVLMHVRAHEPAPNDQTRLSSREKDVLRALVDGLSYKMIAHRLGISFETVRSHIKHIYSKLKVSNNTEAVAKALNGRLLA